MTSEQEVVMLIALAVLLAVAWILGFTVMKVSSVAIHILIVLALVSLAAHFFRRRSSTV
jgi:glucan phosphoethanolaminetransferase (alkaline phosphatase superfamily)